MANIEELKKSLAEIRKSLEETNKVAKELLWNLETLTRYASTTIWKPKEKKETER